ncbi:MAG: methylmalonyl-CoA mutase [Chloroflexi bacterium]|nr:methylmalonyl-CoA mutase [Chloroflexota bacterium]
MKELDKGFRGWKKAAFQEGADEWHVTPRTVSGSNTPRALLYTPLDVPRMDYRSSLGFPGAAPYTRGVRPNMYRGKEFTIRQLAGFGGPEDTNERIKFLLAHGATGVSIVFDLPTIQEYDSDDRASRGQVGQCGVAVDSVDDMDILFRDIPIEKISVSLVTHYPSNTAILFAMYLAMAERRGIPWDSLRGSVQNDFIMETVVRSAPEYLPPGACFKIQCDNMEFIRRNAPRWNFITYNGYNLREAGTNAITESAVAIANAVASLEESIRRGQDADWLGERVAFFWSPASDFFEEVARLRAVRRLWYRIMKHRFAARNPNSMLMRCHVQTSGISLRREEPLNNIVRAAYQGLAAVLGGAQSMHIDSYDEAYSVPGEAAALVSIRNQQIIQAETAVTQVVDPLGGSFYVEALTDEVERRTLDEVDEIEKMGGIVAAVETCWLHRKITDYACNEQRRIEKGEVKIAGYNYFPASDTRFPDIDVFKYPEGVEERQSQKLKILRQQRDRGRVEVSLNELEGACREGRNALLHCIQAARAGATEGEMFKAFRAAFGLWRPLY